MIPSLIPLHLMTQLLRRRLAPPDEAPASDPIDHPLLRGMSPRELADLPFPRPPVQEKEDALGPQEPQPAEPHAVRPAA